MSSPVRSVAVGRGLLLAFVVLLVLGYYQWSVSHALSPYGNLTARAEAYNRLIDGFRAGQLSLKLKPRPELVQLANPYDSEKNRPYRYHDATYYQGRYYIYHGVTPALVLFLPYHLITGKYLWHHEAVAIFCGAGFLVSAGLFLALCRRYFPATGVGVQALCLAGLGLANAVPILLRRAEVWEVPIACGLWLVMTTLACLWQVWHDQRRQVFWLACAATAAGLAIGSRPTLIGTLLVFPAVLFFLRKRQPQSRRETATLVAAALVPLSVIGLGLAAYNYARFGNPLEFGTRYQLTEGTPYSELKFFSWDYVPANFRLYFLTPVNWQSYFPFVRPADLPPLPPGQFGADYACGILVNMPFVWLALALPLAWRRPDLAGLCGWTRLALVLWAGNLIPLLFFGAMAVRYLVDFTPLLVLFAGVGCLLLEQQLGGRLQRWVARLAWGGLLVLSVAFNFFASCEFGGWLNFFNPPGSAMVGSWLQVSDPAGYARLAHAFNQPVAALEKIRHKAPGPLELTVVLPPFTHPHVEPLLVTGYGVATDYVWIEYLDASQIRLGVEHTLYGGLVSAPLAIDPAGEQRIRIEVGGLYPPREHPYFDAFSPAEALRRQETVRIDLNGRNVVAGSFIAYAASPETRWVGENPFAPHLGRQFTGKIRAQRTLPENP